MSQQIEHGPWSWSCDRAKKACFVIDGLHILMSVLLSKEPRLQVCDSARIAVELSGLNVCNHPQRQVLCALAQQNILR